METTRFSSGGRICGVNIPKAKLLDKQFFDGVVGKLF